VGSLESGSTGKIHLFYVNSNEKLAGQILRSDGSMSAHTFPSLPVKHADSQLAAAYDPDTEDVQLWYQESNAGIRTLQYTEAGGWTVRGGAQASAPVTEGTALAAVTWKGPNNATENRVFFIDANQDFAQFQWASDTDTWSTGTALLYRTHTTRVSTLTDRCA
jgi:hypothetical protein